MKEKATVACSNPHTVSFKADGKTITWSQKEHSKEYAPFQLPCGKCLECRLDYARGWAIRCVHEAQMHEKTCFITLTYDDEHLTSNKLIYDDFQKFMKRLRRSQNDPIGMFVTGEYGDKNKRPHWHAILFNYRPSDAEHKYTSDRGDRVFSSEALSKLWGKGTCEFGDVTLASAGYCARYAAKKLTHGQDQDHDFHPISKKSSKHAIGKKWLEKYWADVFNYGYVIHDDIKLPIPRYYEKWLQKEMPDLWLRYVTETKIQKQTFAQKKSELEDSKLAEVRQRRTERGNFLYPVTQKEARKKILKSKFEKQLQAYLKL